MNNNDFVLTDALEKYVETGDELLINEKVYDEYCRYVQYVSKKYDILPNEPIDEKVSIVNYYLWNNLRLFDKDRASMVTFLTIIIKNSLLMEIRKRNSMNNKINDTSVSFDDIVIIKYGGEREVTRGEFIGNEDNHIISFEIQDMFNKIDGAEFSFEGIAFWSSTLGDLNKARGIYPGAGSVAYIWLSYGQRVRLIQDL